MSKSHTDTANDTKNLLTAITISRQSREREREREIPNTTTHTVVLESTCDQQAQKLGAAKEAAEEEDRPKLEEDPR